MIRSRIVRTSVALISILVIAAAYWIWDHRDYWFLNNFRVVEPGRVYAGGYQYPGPLQRMIKQHGIKTVVSLRGDDGESDEDEQATLASNGVAYRRVIIPFKVSEAERLERIQEAVDLIADPANQPVYVHCWAGYHRTGAVVAIYRVSRCGWSEHAALDEMLRWGGAAQNVQWPTRCLHAFCAHAPVPQTATSESRPNF